jgi:ATP-dependent DNA helicase DinG
MLHSYNKNISRIICLFAHTGNADDEGNRIYEVAAAPITPDGCWEIFSSPVRYRKTTERDYHLSGLSRDTLQRAPIFADVASFVLPMFRETDIIATLNAPEEIETLASICGKPRAVDLRFAAEFFLPQVNIASLKSLWEYLNKKHRAKFSFSAEEAVSLSIDLLKHICGTVLNPAEFPPATTLRFYLRKSDTLFGNLFLHLNGSYRNYFGGLFEFEAGGETSDWKGFLEKAPQKTPLQGEKEQQKKVSFTHVEQSFRALSAGTKGYTVRPSQIAYAKHVAAALNEREVLTIEAGTGTGKTQGYLIPAMEFLIRNPGARVAISTYTKNLQEQIIKREIPLTKSLKPAFLKIPVAMLKGKSNYLCAEKLDHAYEETLSGGRLLLWLYFANKIFHFRQTDGDIIGERVRFYLNDGFFFRRLHHEISARSGCSKKHSRCPAQIITAEAMNAPLIVTNHHKLALLNKDDALAGLFGNCIIDEANHFEQAVRAAFALEVSSRELSDSSIFIETTLQRIAPFWTASAGKMAAAGLDGIHTFREELSVFTSALISIREFSSTKESFLIPAEHPAFREGRLKEQLLDIRKTLRKITNCLSFFRDAESCRQLGIHYRTAERLRTALQDIDDHAEALKAIAEKCETPEYVTSAVFFVHHWTVSTRAVEVAEILRDHLYNTWDSVIFTSATLRQGKSFTGFMSIAGMTSYNASYSGITPENPPNLKKGDHTQKTIEKNGNGSNDSQKKRDFRFEAIPSPFAPSAVLISVPPEAISGAYEAKDLWLSRVAEMLPDLIRRNRGRTLVLFASYGDLREIAASIGDDIRSYGYPLLIQQNGVSTLSLVDEFRAIKESVLFGVDTFWFGVDFPGDTLTQVIITRLPFPHPHDPLQIARRNILPQREYWRRYRYETAIKLRQGIGRLIRSEEDSGQVVILDARYRPYYGKSLIADYHKGERLKK